MSNIHKYGNPSAASVPIALHEAQAEGKIKDGDKVMLISFGAGVTWAAALLQWGEKRKELSESAISGQLKSQWNQVGAGLITPLF